MDSGYVAECEDCGAIVERVDDPATIARIAAAPYAYMVWCRSCGQERAAEEATGG